MKHFFHLNKFFHLLLLLFMCFIFSQINAQHSRVFPYDISNPANIILLDDELDEISGIAVHDDHIYAIQDEKAHIYKLNMHGEIKTKYDFGKNDDYEDITIAGGHFFVLRSDGTIFEIDELKKKKKDKKEDVDSKKHKTKLSSYNDTEGLCYDPLTHSLLIACKAYGGLEPGDEKADVRAVYRYDLVKKKLIKDAFMKIHLDSVQNEENESFFDRISVQIASFLHESGDIRFQPSGIAVHPFTQDIYLLSANSYGILIIDREGRIKKFVKLSKDSFQQAEGICFDREGKLYISNEANSRVASILIFNYLSD